MDKEKNRTYDYIRLGKRIQARRKEIGLTQEELAEKIDCSLTHLSRLESGSPPGLDTLIRLCYLLGYSLDEMVGLYPSPSPYVHEVCDLFLVHTEDEQKFALWLMQYFFYVLDQKELDYKFRKRRTKSAEITVNHLMEVLPNTKPEEFIKQFTSAFADLPVNPKRRRKKKSETPIPPLYSPPEDSPLIASEDSTTDPIADPLN
ncbi:MAG: helix-turn-helix transcriptional regulator [Anaerotignum sp.]|nr:helix-turn-helix transcriptional regulator [Anaerotignum sp.]